MGSVTFGGQSPTEEGNAWVKNSPAIPELKDTSEKNGLPNAFYNLSLKKNKIALSKTL